MAAAQPLNSAIKVYRSVRSIRNLKINRSVFQTFQRVATQVMAVPNLEGRTVTATRNSVYTTDTSIGGLSGLPVVRYERDLTSLSTAVETITGLDFPVRIGSDSFLVKTEANVTDDLHENLRDVTADTNA